VDEFIGGGRGEWGKVRRGDSIEREKERERGVGERIERRK
jgi:hypothetical protein